MRVYTFYFFGALLLLFGFTIDARADFVVTSVTSTNPASAGDACVRAMIGGYYSTVPEIAAQVISCTPYGSPTNYPNSSAGRFYASQGASGGDGYTNTNGSLGDAWHYGCGSGGNCNISPASPGYGGVVVYYTGGTTPTCASGTSWNNTTHSCSCPGGAAQNSDGSCEPPPPVLGCGTAGESATYNGDTPPYFTTAGGTQIAPVDGQTACQSGCSVTYHSARFSFAGLGGTAGKAGSASGPTQVTTNGTACTADMLQVEGGGPTTNSNPTDDQCHDQVVPGGGLNGATVVVSVCDDDTVSPSDGKETENGVDHDYSKQPDNSCTKNTSGGATCFTDFAHTGATPPVPNQGAAAPNSAAAPDGGCQAQTYGASGLNGGTVTTYTCQYSSTTVNNSTNGGSYGTQSGTSSGTTAGTTGGTSSGGATGGSSGGSTGGTSGGTGDISGGTDCTTPPTGDGDPVAMYQAHEQWVVACAYQKPPASQLDADTDTALGTTEEGGLLRQIGTTTDVSAWFDSAATDAGTSCPADISIPLPQFNTSFTAKISQACPYVALVRAFWLISCSLTCLFIYFKG